MISLIIIHWNTPELLRHQLQNLKDLHTDEIIVVDNASKNTVSWISTDFPRVRLIQNTRNRGYAAACNQGATLAQGEWMLFLNPDVLITPAHITQLVLSAERNGFVACSPTPPSANYQKPVPTWLTLLTEFSPLKHIRSNAASDTGYTLTGGCLLIQSEVLRKLGGWDERFFIWFEDSDLTARLINHGYTTGFVPVTIDHAGGKSFEQLSNQYKRDVFFHSMDVYARKHFSWFGQLMIKFLKKRYSKRNVLPGHHTGISLTVPNMRPALIEKFFLDNFIALSHVDELIIVTSGIKPHEVWDWRKKYPTVRFILLEHNRGVASTINVGLRASTGAWIGTANDDVILTEHWIHACLQCDGPKVGALNPVIYRIDGSIESVGVKVHKKGKATPIMSMPSHTDFQTIDAVNAATVLYKNPALNQVGIFDERFRSYLEDIDLSLRMRRAGWENRVCLQSKVTHLGHATASTHLKGKKAWLDFRNWFYVIAKNWSLSDLALNFPNIMVERLRNVSGVIKSL